MTREAQNYHENAVSLYYDDACKLHSFNHIENIDADFDDHSEKPDRIGQVFEYLIELSDLKDVKVIKNQGYCASREEQLICHTEAYLENLENFKFFTDDRLNEISGNGRSQTDAYDSIYGSRYAPISASIGLGTCIQCAVDLTSSEQQKSSFCLTRPPGHHAYASKPSGFCFLNNAAITAKYLLKNKLASKVAIVDWDVHHGNGTQDLTYSDEDILFVSLHRGEEGTFYPSGDAGSYKNIGNGYNINIPFSNLKSKFPHLPRQKQGDAEYIFTVERIVCPILKKFSPDYLIISAGFDAGEGDPLGGYGVSPVGFADMLEHLVLASGNAKTQLILEGGYNITTLKTCIEACLEKLVLISKDGYEPTLRKIDIANINFSTLKNLAISVPYFLDYWNQNGTAKQLVDLSKNLHDEILLRERQKTRSSKSPPNQKSSSQLEKSFSSMKI